MNWLDRLRIRGVQQSEVSTEQELTRDDLNDAIKEIARLRYRVLELEIRLSNAEETIKILLK